MFEQSTVKIPTPITFFSRELDPRLRGGPETATGAFDPRLAKVCPKDATHFGAGSKILPTHGAGGVFVRVGFEVDLKQDVTSRLVRTAFRAHRVVSAPRHGLSRNSFWLL